MLALLLALWPLENPGDRVGVPDADVDAASAWEVTTGDPSVVVAVIDTGVDVAHPALAGAIAVNEGEVPANGVDDDANGFVDDVTGWDFADGDADVSDAGIPHGTMVTGVVLSLAPGVSVLPVKVFSSTGADGAFESAAAAGIGYALDRGARVLQIAWELSGPPGATLQAAFDEAESAGAIVVVAAGNAGLDLDETARYPASLANANVIAVAGTDRYDEPVENVGLFVTNHGTSAVEIAAPTEKVETTFPGGGRILFTGTSASAPFVSAAAALVLSVDPALTAAAVKDALMAGADRLPSLEGKVASGRLNANNAVRIATGANASPPRAVAGRVDRAPAERVILFDGSATESFYPLLEASWSFGDGVVVESLNAERRFDTGGTWPATLEVVDTVGMRHVARTFVTVPARETEIASSLESAHPYPAGTQLVTSVAAPGATSFRLRFERIEIAPGDSLLVFDEERTGVWWFTGSAEDVVTPEIRGASAFLYLRGGNGGAFGFALDALLARFPGDANHEPVVAIDGAVGAAIGEEAVFTAAASDPDGDAMSLEWRLLSRPADSDAELAVDGDTATIVPDAEGNYGILVTARDAAGLESSSLAWTVTRDRDRTASCAVAAPTRAPSPLMLAPLALLLLHRRKQAGLNYSTIRGILEKLRPACLLVVLAGCVKAPPTGIVPPVKHTIEAPDGWKLALHHYPVPDGAPVRARPVLLCHGLGSNHHSLDLDEGASLARHLAKEGFDVWALDLRGHGDSRKPPKGKKRSKTDFDDYVRLDAPAAVAYVTDQTRSEGVAWVGHSMGGMIGLAHAGRGGEGIDALVTIASGGTVKQSGLVYGIANLSGWTAIFPAVPTRAIGRMNAATVGGWWAFHLDNYVYNRENLLPRERKLLAGTALENLSRAETRQFRKWVKERTFVSKDGKDDYAANLAKIEVPVLLLSGSVDRIVPPPNVQHAMVRLGSSDKTHRVVGLSEGFDWEFGHVDIVSGRRAASAVFPVITDWLSTRDPTACAPLPSAIPVLP